MSLGVTDSGKAYTLRSQILSQLELVAASRCGAATQTMEALSPRKRLSHQSTLDRFSADVRTGPGDRKLANKLKSTLEDVSHAAHAAVSNVGAVSNIVTLPGKTALRSLVGCNRSNAVMPGKRSTAGEYTITIELNGTPVAIRCERYMQHTISWQSTLTIGPGSSTAVDELLSDAAKQAGSPMRPRTVFDPPSSAP